MRRRELSAEEIAKLQRRKADEGWDYKRYLREYYARLSEIRDELEKSLENPKTSAEQKAAIKETDRVSVGVNLPNKYIFVNITKKEALRLIKDHDVKIRFSQLSTYLEFVDETPEVKA